MKHTTSAAPLALGLALALALSGCRQPLTPSDAPLDAPSDGGEVTRANFVGLEEARAGGYIFMQFQTSVSSKAVRLHPGAPGDKAPTLQAKLSRAELDSMIKVLNEARFTKIAGDYENPGAADAISHIVTLSLKQPGGAKPRSYTVSDNVGRAPKAFEKVTTWLSDLRQRKFPHAKQR